MSEVVAHAHQRKLTAAECPLWPLDTGPHRCGASSLQAPSRAGPHQLRLSVSRPHNTRELRLAVLRKLQREEAFCSLLMRRGS